MHNHVTLCKSYFLACLLSLKQSKFHEVVHYCLWDTTYTTLYQVGFLFVAKHEIGFSLKAYARTMGIVILFGVQFLNIILYLSMHFLSL